MIGREDEVREYRDQMWVFHVVLVIAWALLITRLFYLQVIKGDELRHYSEENRLKKEKLFPTRGIIYDRDGKVIVDNRAAFDVVLLSQYFHDSDAMDARLAKALEMTPEELDKKLAKMDRTPSYYPLLLKADVSKDIIANIETDAKGFPGIDIEATVQRRYPFGSEAAQLLGYTSEVDARELANDTKHLLQRGDYIGRMGLERTYDSQLRGVDGTGYVEVDAMGRRRTPEGAEKVLGFVAETDPIPGNNVYLTIDSDLENAAAQALNAKGYSGSVVALDPRTGEILALVNEPSFNPGSISGRDVDPKVWAALRNNKDRPLRDRAFQDIYPPGSTFKPLMAIAALASGKATPRTTFNCRWAMRIGNRVFHCWKEGGHGPIQMIRAIQSSCDIYFYNIGNLLGIDTIAKYVRMFGLGQRTGIQLPGESRGLIPDSEWKEKVYHQPWYPGETPSVAIGQGYVSVTPLQLVNAYAAIANGGFLYRPYLVKRIERRGGEIIKEFHPELKRKIDLPQEVFDTVREGLWEVVNKPGGTAYLTGRSKIADISGKTGTAQVKSLTNYSESYCPTMPRQYRNHAWFVGYAPRDKPEIAVVALAEHACRSPEAAAIVKQVMEVYFQKQAAEKAKAIPMAGNLVAPTSAGIGGILANEAKIGALATTPKPAAASPSPSPAGVVNSSTPSAVASERKGN